MVIGMACMMLSSFGYLKEKQGGVLSLRTALLALGCMFFSGCITPPRPYSVPTKIEQKAAESPYSPLVQSLEFELVALEQLAQEARIENNYDLVYQYELLYAEKRQKYFQQKRLELGEIVRRSPYDALRDPILLREMFDEKMRTGSVPGLVLEGEPQVGESVIPVHSYRRDDGREVQEHYRTKPDGDPSNNFSTKGNVNPFTGRRGTK